MCFPSHLVSSLGILRNGRSVVMASHFPFWVIIRLLEKVNFPLLRVDRE